LVPGLFLVNFLEVCFRHGEKGSLYHWGTLIDSAGKCQSLEESLIQGAEYSSLVFRGVCALCESDVGIVVLLF
jgi:hypothetical protein